jgi:hypothetical protein
MKSNQCKNTNRINRRKEKLRLTELYTLRPYGARAPKNRSRAAPFVRFSLCHISGVAETASQFLLSGTKKCHIQPGRYAQLFLNFSENIGKVLTEMKR